MAEMERCKERDSPVNSLFYSALFHTCVFDFVRLYSTITPTLLHSLRLLLDSADVFAPVLLHIYSRFHSIFR